MTNPSLRHRYLSKLSANVISMVVNLGIAALVPRALGPASFGNFEFLRDFFTKLLGFFQMGTLNAFYVKLSQRQKEFSIIVFYLRLILLIFFGIFLFTTIVCSLDIRSLILPDQKIKFVYMAMIFGCLAFIVKVITQIFDAYGLTIYSEITRIYQRIFGLAIIVGLYMCHTLNLATVFYYHYTVQFFFILVLIILLCKKRNILKENYHLSFEQFKRYVQEFFHYCHPLASATFFGFITGIFGRWLLQYFGGSVQQGFFGLGDRIGMVCFLFTSAMTPLIMREFSIAYNKNNIKEMARLFRRYVPMLYTFVAYVSCYIIVQADKVIFLFGGSRFDNALMPVTLMAFYPVHQTYGQLSGSVFFATDQTRLYRNIAIFYHLLQMPVLYFLIAPKHLFGFNAGATGLAINMVAIQFLSVNTLLYFNSKLLSLNYWKYIGHQIVSVLLLLLFALFAAKLIEILFVDMNAIFQFFLSGILYTLFVISLVLLFPRLAGLTRVDIVYLMRKGLRFLHE